MARLCHSQPLKPCTELVLLLSASPLTAPLHCSRQLPNSLMAFVSTISSRPFAAVTQFAPSLAHSQTRCLGFLACHDSRINSSLTVSTSLACCCAARSSLFGRTLGLRLVVGFIPHFKPFRMSGIAYATAVTEKSLHDFTVKDISGNDVDLRTYKGKVLLVVNVASQCGLTASNYTELSEIYNKYKGQDFEILAFPCNQFGGQEPGTNEQIKEFACTRFKAEFPIFDKVEVNGANAAPVYKFLKSTKSGGILEGLLGDKVKWNFEKFLVDKNGQVIQRYSPTTPPLKIEKDIKELLDT